MPPIVEDTFEWTPAPWGLALRALALAHVPHGWTTRQLQLRGKAGIERDGWRSVAEAAGARRGRLVRLHQVHGAAIHVAGGEADDCGAPEADIALSDTGGLAVAVQVADCAPVLVADREGTVVAASHAGWRGTAANVAGVTVAAIADGWRREPAALDAAIGPCIGPCCYEVGLELLQAFHHAGWSSSQTDRWFARRDGKLFLDIWTANADQLTQAGMPPSQVHVSRLCTACHPEWLYSYRRDGPGTGRLAGYISPVEATQPYRA
jgi:polyphenol oxidase